MKYKTVKVQSNEEWDAFVMASPQGSVFATSAYLANFENIERKFICKGNAVKAAVYFPIDGDHKFGTANFLIHSGIIFEPQGEQTLVKYNNARFEIAEFFTEHVLETYEHVIFSCHPEVQDMRPFLWHNYHEPSKRQYSITARYTSIVDISDLFLKKPLDECPCFSAIDSIRRRDITKGHEEGLEVNFNFNPDTLKALYAETMKKSEATDGLDGQLRDLENIVSALEQNSMGFQVNILRDGEVTYSAYFSVYKNIACYLFAAGSPERMQRNDASFCVWNSFLKASEFGAHSVDMEGINSPQRGDFKLGFGGRIVPYFRVFQQ